jgi:hypothetical protein
MLARSLPQDPVLPTGPDRAAWPAELQLLLGDGAAEILSVVATGAGAGLGHWSPRSVSHQPGSSAVVQYDAELRWPDGSATKETIVGATGARIPAGADIVELGTDTGTSEVAAWRWPADPGLPGLARAMDPVAVGGILDDLGIDGGPLGLRIRAYRPGRRAVIEATGRRDGLFLKVVRPRVAEALLDIHRTLAQHLPVPEGLGRTADGLVVLTAMPGRTLRDLLRSGRTDLPDPGLIGALLDRLPPGLAEGASRADHFANVERHALAISSVLPEAAGRLQELRGRLGEAAASDAAASHLVVPVHGDLYEAQLLVTDGRFSGLLDVDTAGAGVRADDWANLCAHLSVLAHVTGHSKAIRRYEAAVLAHAEAETDAADLRARSAAAVVGLATGPFRVLERDWPANTMRRLDLAARWLER